MTGAGSAADRRRAAVLVAAQLALLAVLAAPARRGRPAVAAWTGRLLTGAGAVGVLASARVLGPGLTPSPLPAEHGELRRERLYAHVRHPMYTSVLLGAAGRVVSAGPGRTWAALALALLLTGKARWEERLLAARHPGYAAYAARTPRFVPGLRPRWPGLRPRRAGRDGQEPIGRPV